MPQYAASQAGSLDGMDYQYHLKDHLGNVRVTFSTTPENYEMEATMEDANEQTMFANYVATSDGAIANSGTHVFRNSNTVNGGLGMNTFLSVNKGDTIKASAYAYYNDAGGSYNLAAGLIEGALFSSFGANYGVEGTTVTQTNFDNAFASGTALGYRSTSSSAPPAYINYLVFDKEMNFVTASFTQITSASNGAMAQVMATDYIADREGYVMVYLSNETQGSELVVSWDDLNVYHGKTNVVSTQDYYPFGLTFNNYERTASTVQRFKFGGKEKDEMTGWTDFGARMYMDDIGRWGVLDQMADRGYHLSPYNYSFNNPIRYTDPDGNWPWESKTVRTARKFARATGGKFSRIPKGSRHNFGGAVARVKIAGTVTGDNVAHRYRSRVLKYQRDLTSDEEYDLGFVNFKEGENYGRLFDTSTKLANGAGAIALALESAVIIGILPPGVIGMDGKIDLEALTTLMFAQKGSQNHSLSPDEVEKLNNTLNDPSASRKDKKAAKQKLNRHEKAQGDRNKQKRANNKKNKPKKKKRNEDG